MRIVVVAGAFAPNRFGAPAVLSEQIAIGLRDRGHQVFVIAGMGAQDEGCLSRWEVSGIPVVGVGVPPSARSGLVDAPVVEERVAEVLTVLQPDVVHLHSAEYLGQAPLRAAQRLGHACVISQYEGRAGWPVEALSAVDRVVVSGSSTRTGLVGFGVAADQIRLIANGAAPPAVDWRRTPHDGPLRFGFLGGLQDALGYGLLVQALGLLGRTDYELHVLDRATARGVRAIREWDFRVPGLVRFVPRFPPSARDAYFGGIDVLLALPQDPASACLSVREALLRGVWPIASDVEAAAQVVSPGKNGTLVPTGSADRLAQAVAWAVDHRAAIKSAAEDPVQGIPTIDQQAVALEAVYADLVPVR